MRSVIYRTFWYALLLPIWGACLTACASDDVDSQRPVAGEAVAGGEAVGGDDESVTPPTASGPISINFQPADHPVPAGMLSDTGEMFGSRGNGYSYGWSVDHTGRTLSYAPPFDGLNDRYWTLTELVPGSTTTWEMALPSGRYDVQIVAGGPVNAGSVQRLLVEGLPIVDAMPGDYAPWVSGTRTVSVEDGRLSIQNTADAPLNRICFLTVGPCLESCGK